MGAERTAAEALTGRVARVQRDNRLPSLSAAAWDGERLLVASAGDPRPESATQFRIGSITKTFTAVLILCLHEEGRLDLDDPLERHVPGTPAGERTLRELLSHRAGLVRELPGPFWEAVDGPTPEELLAALTPDVVIPDPPQAWHYSNLAFALLGLVVERAEGAAFADVLRRRLLEPLELARTSWLPTAPSAQGYRVHPHSPRLLAEPHADTRAMGPAGQLWSTPSDLVRWGIFLARGDEAVLPAASVARLWAPVSVTDPAWSSGYGLGVQLFRRGDTVLAGHGGSMPGFIAGLAVDPATGVAAAACGNAWQGADLPGLAAEVVVDLAGRRQAEPWTSGEVPDWAAELLGRWWYRGVGVDGEWDGRQFVLRRGPRIDPFERRGTDLFRGTSGGQAGETLRVLRDDASTPAVLDAGGWLFTRDLDDPRGGP